MSPRSLEDSTRCGEHDLGTHSAPYNTRGWAKAAGWDPKRAGNGGEVASGDGCAGGVSLTLCNKSGTTGHNRAAHNFGYPGAGDCCNPTADWAKANNATAAALFSQGYAHRYTYVHHGCHCDPRIYYSELPNDLVWAFSEYQQS